MNIVVAFKITLQAIGSIHKKVAVGVKVFGCIVVVDGCYGKHDHQTNGLWSLLTE